MSGYIHLWARCLHHPISGTGPPGSSQLRDSVTPQNLPQPASLVHMLPGITSRFLQIKHQILLRATTALAASSRVLLQPHYLCMWLLSPAQPCRSGPIPLPDSEQMLRKYFYRRGHSRQILKQQLVQGQVSPPGAPSTPSTQPQRTHNSSE